MRLSNLVKVAMLTCIAMLAVSCGGGTEPAANQPPTVNPAAAPEFPFSVKEPEVYQGDFVVESAGGNQRWFAARKGPSWRIDTFSGIQQLVRTELEHNGSHYIIDHRTKTYITQPGSIARRFIGSLAEDVFRGKENFAFEEVGRENGLIKYRAKRSADSKGEVLITFDEKSGMIVRQEFANTSQAGGNAAPPFVYEVRNLKLEADDSLFALPEGYKSGKSDKTPAASPAAK
jgi:hypothetical protein